MALTASHHHSSNDTFMSAHLQCLLSMRSNSSNRETRMFAHSAAAAEAMQQQQPSPRAHTAGGSQEPGFLEVFPRAASHPPRLLQQLEALLVDRLRVNDRLASTALLLAKGRDPNMGANLSLDAHRRVLASFAQGFPAYTPLLARIQGAFEEGLAEGLRCAVQNVAVREQLREGRLARRRAGMQMRAKMLEGEHRFKCDAYTRLQGIRECVNRNTRRALQAERERDRLRAEVARLEGLVAVQRAKHEKLQACLAREQEHAAQPVNAQVMGAKIKSLTTEDIGYLKAEQLGFSLSLEETFGRGRSW